jgi:hypothetical protein
MFKSRTEAPDKQLLQLTLRYQKEHPDMYLGKPELGRISLEGKKIFNQEAVHLFILEDQTRKIVLDSQKSDDEKAKLAADHFSTKNNSDKAAAVLEINGILNLMRSVSTEGHALNSSQLRKLEQAVSLSEDDQQTFVLETKHMAITPLVQASWIFDDAVKLLQK